MNLIDELIIVLIIAAVRRGLRIGMLRLVLSAIGFLAGLYLGSLLAGVVAPHFSTIGARLFVTLGVNLVCAFTGASIGEVAGIQLSELTSRIHLKKLNEALGAAFELVFTLFLVWLIAAPLSNVQDGNLGRSVQRSSIVSTLNRNLPPAPDLLSELGRVISSSGLPQVFIGDEPQPKTVVTTTALNTPAVQAAQKSIVKIEGYGCGGIVEGSGFVARPGIVVTNAHVVAGVARPRVIDGTKTYNATPIWFDEDLDMALLSVPRLPLNALPVVNDVAPDKTPVAIMGYPGGGPLTISDGVIIDNLRAVGRNIYNRGLVSRQIYEVQGDVEPGNSGGPLVNAKGEVIGLVFAKSVGYDSVGYALLTTQIITPLNSASNDQTAVYTGRCAAA